MDSHERIRGPLASLLILHALYEERLDSLTFEQVEEFRTRLEMLDQLILECIPMLLDTPPAGENPSAGDTLSTAPSLL